MLDGLADATESRAEPAPSRPAQGCAIDLAATRLSKNFDGAKEILKSVSFQISRGQAVALVGPNGAGKSTLLRCCVGLISIDGGSARLLWWR